MTSIRTILRNASILIDGRWKKGHMIISDGIVEELIFNKASVGSHSGDSESIDCKQDQIIPGLYDGHMHMFEYGIDRMTVDLSGVRSSEELLKTIDRVYFRECQNKCFDRTGIIWGTGYDDSTFSKPFSISLKDIDSRYGEHPLIIRRICGHLSYANSAFIESFEGPLKKIRTSRLDDKYGMDLSHGLLIDDEMAEFAYSISRDFLYSKGVVGGLEIISPNRYDHFMKAYRSRGAGLNLSLSLVYPGQGSENELFEKCIADQGRYNYLSKRDLYCPIAFMKSFADGSIGSRTASFTFDYTDGTKAEPLMDRNDVLNMILKSRSYGLIPMIHCIGDEAVDSVLSGSKSMDWPVRLEHVEMARNDQIDILSSDKYMVCMQPNFSDIWGRKNGLYHRNLGPFYIQLNRYRRMLDKGVRICFGTDMMPPGPIEAMRGAVDHPVRGSRISFEKAISMFSERSCDYSSVKGEAGSISEGVNADIVLIDKLSKIKKVFYRGQVVHELVTESIQ